MGYWNCLLLVKCKGPQQIIVTSEKATEFTPRINEGVQTTNNPHLTYILDGNQMKIFSGPDYRYFAEISITLSHEKKGKNFFQNYNGV